MFYLKLHADESLRFSWPHFAYRFFGLSVTRVHCGSRVQLRQPITKMAVLHYPARSAILY